MNATQDQIHAQHSTLAAILAAGILRLDWRKYREQAAMKEDLSVYSQKSLDDCSEINPPVSTPPTVGQEKGGISCQ